VLPVHRPVRTDIMTGLPNVGEVLRTHSQLFPERVGARDLERTMTFRQWNARSCRLANALLGLGLGKGNCVAVLAYNRVEWLEIYAATAVAVPVNFRLVGAEIAYIVENCEAVAFIVENALVETVEQIRAELSVATRISFSSALAGALQGIALTRTCSQPRATTSPT
jgi:fatty-acyl-CoA synthase